MQELKNSGAPCKYKRWHWMKKSTGEVSRFRCNSWECDEYRSVVAERASRGASCGEADYLLTMMNVPDDKGECRLKWQHLSPFQTFVS